MPPDCIFCSILSGDAQGEIIYRDQTVTAFRDSRPAAPVHILVVPNIHIASISDIRPEDESLLGHLFTAANQIAVQEGLSGSGYRLIINQGPDSGQAVFHLHLHILGGRRLGHLG
jgi:histidine triad (HIT) family protein